MYKVSLIIPVYNAELSLKNTIKSVMNQTLGFENIELILVDDNSNDDSKQIISELVRKYSNIKPIFLKENSGNASYPRNVGIENATAEYLLFMDSDDEIFSNYCEILLDKITAHNVEIVCCNKTTKISNQTYISKYIENINTSEKYLDDIEKMYLRHTAWGSIYKTSLIKEHNIKFPDTLHEDGVFSADCLLKTDETVIYLPNYPGYIYSVDSDGSLSHKLNLNSMRLFLKGYELFNKLLKENTSLDIEKALMNECVRMAMFILLKVDDLDGGVKLLSDFENSLDFKIDLGLKPFKIINQKIINKQFIQAKIPLKIMRVFYSKKRFRNYFFIKYSRIKPLK